MALPNQEFFTAAELSAVLRVSTKTILRMANRGALPCYQLGRARRFRREEVEKFLSGVRQVGRNHEATRRPID
jgi:excisionase family DNA binding protein